MKTVISLFSNREDVEQACQHLYHPDLIDPQQIQILSSEIAVNELLSGQQSQVLAIYGGWGLFAGLVLFGLYNLISLVCDCGLMIFNFWVELDVLFLFIGAGMMVAGITAYFLQVERLNSSFRPYIYNVDHGSLIVAVETPSSLQETVIDILHQHNGAAIKTLESRFSSYRRKKSQPMRYYS